MISPNRSLTATVVPMPKEITFTARFDVFDEVEVQFT
jgi:hypothetical protein